MHTIAVQELLTRHFTSKQLAYAAVRDFLLAAILPSDHADGLVCV